MREKGLWEMNDIIEVNGEKYANTKIMAQLWNVTTQCVRDYCKQEKISGIIRIGKNRIFVPINSRKPLQEKQTKRLLFLVLQLKNNPNFEIDWNALELAQDEIYEAYKILEQSGYVKYFEKDEKKPESEIPYIVELTEKGMQSALSHKEKKEINWTEFFVSIIPCVFELGVQYVSSKIKN